MAHDPYAKPDFSFTLEVFNFYLRLMQAAGAADPHAEQEPSLEPSVDASLGGKLLWVGELDSAGRGLIVAGNIAGAATITATADPDAQKQAVRDGIVDFLVNSLDEALRILKNEIRKKQAVAVCIGASPASIANEMMERGVRPDLFREAAIGASEQAEARSEAVPLDSMGMKALVTWRAGSAPAHWLPKLDAIALECLPDDDGIARRWLRLAGRSLGRLGNAGHLLVGNREFAARMVERVRDQVLQGKINARVQIQVGSYAQIEEHNFSPSNYSSTN